MFYQDGGKLATLKWLERGGAAISTTSRALDSYDRTSMTGVGGRGRGRNDKRNAGCKEMHLEETGLLKREARSHASLERKKT